MEEWSPIEDFPGYEVSSHGRVRNANTGYELGVYDNGHGILQVVIRRDGRNVARAVHRLVAETFLYPGPEGTVPVHLDGDWKNNRVENLDWKPRWFAMKRTRQAKRTVPMDARPIRMVKGDVIYENALACAKDIGGLEDLILLTVGHPERTYFGSTFEFVHI